MNLLAISDAQNHDGVVFLIYFVVVGGILLALFMAFTFRMRMREMELQDPARLALIEDKQWVYVGHLPGWDHDDHDFGPNDVYHRCGLCGVKNPAIKPDKIGTEERKAY